MKYRVILLLLFTPLSLFAQDMSSDADIAKKDEVDKLFELAWKNYAETTSYASETKIARLNVRQAKVGWLNHAFVSGNLNEITLNETLGTGGSRIAANNLFFPRYNIGVSIPLGTFFTQPIQRKIAEEQLTIAEAGVVRQKATLKEAFLTKYYDYMMYSKLLKLQDEITSDQYSKLILLEGRFKSGDVGLEEYNVGLLAYQNEERKKIEAMRNYQVSKATLETLLGTPLEKAR